MFFEDLLVDDVKQGDSLVMPREAVLNIPDALIAPLNVQKQNIINKCREIIDKKWLTHN